MLHDSCYGGFNHYPCFGQHQIDSVLPAKTDIDLYITKHGKHNKTWHRSFLRNPISTIYSL